MYLKIMFADCFSFVCFFLIYFIQIMNNCHVSCFLKYSQSSETHFLLSFSVSSANTHTHTHTHTQLPGISHVFTSSLHTTDLGSYHGFHFTDEETETQGGLPQVP